MKEAIVVIPGIMGSELKDNGEVIWPGKIWELKSPYKHMESLRKPDLEVSDIIRDYPFEKQYADLIESLNKGGFEEGENGTLRVYPYDWRKDNALAADGLAKVIDDFVLSLGDDCSIILLAHSMGGLVARYYLESDIYSRRSGFSKVSTLITMGTPHKGAPMALAAAVGMEKRAFLNAKQVQEIANDSNFPSLYQLLPPKGEPFAWDRKPEERYAHVDIYDDKNAKALKLSLDNLKSAEMFHEKLGLSRKPTKVRYFFFAGTQNKTTSSVQIETTADGGLTLIKDERDDAGDGTVPFWSGSQSGIQTEAVGGAHATIYKGKPLKFILGGLLGRSGRLAAVGGVAEISVDPPVVEVEGKFQVVINLPVGTIDMNAALKLYRVDVDPATGAIASETFFKDEDVSYKGPEIDHLTVVLATPPYPGVYKIGFAPRKNAAEVASVILIVQDI